MMTDMTGDFYEEDEPVEKIKAAFDRGTKHVTRRPGAAPRGQTTFLAMSGQPVPTSSRGSGDQHTERELVAR